MEQSGDLPLLREKPCNTPEVRYHGLLGVLAVAVCLGAAMCAPAAPPTTAPADPQAIDQAVTIRRAFRDLADPKPSVREEARSWLLTLNREDLPLLREVVKRSRPVQRSQVAALREIVAHVYLRGDPYERDPSGGGFMGVIFGVEIEGNEPEGGGVEFRARMCGFCAYRYLQDGDIIRAIVGHPTISVHSYREVTAVVSAYHAGDTVVLEVLRDARILRIPVVLDPRPAVAITNNTAATAEFLGRRQAEADNFWDENFEPLVNESVS